LVVTKHGIREPAGTEASGPHSRSQIYHTRSSKRKSPVDSRGENREIEITGILFRLLTKHSEACHACRRRGGPSVGRAPTPMEERHETKARDEVSDEPAGAPGGADDGGGSVQRERRWRRSHDDRRRVLRLDRGARHHGTV